MVSPGTTVSSTNKTDSHDITEILLKVALNASGLVRASNTLSVIVFLVLGAFLGMMSVRSEIEFRRLICLFFVFLLLGGHRDSQVKLFY